MIHNYGAMSMMPLRKIRKSLAELAMKANRDHAKWRELMKERDTNWRILMDDDNWAIAEEARKRLEVAAENERIHDRRSTRLWLAVLELDQIVHEDELATEVKTAMEAE